MAVLVIGQLEGGDAALDARMMQELGARFRETVGQIFYGPVMVQQFFLNALRTAPTSLGNHFPPLRRSLHE